MLQLTLNERGTPALLEALMRRRTTVHAFGHAPTGFLPIIPNILIRYLLWRATLWSFFLRHFNEKIGGVVSQKSLRIRSAYQLGTIPEELIDKIKKSGTINQGYSPIENLAASIWICNGIP